MSSQPRFMLIKTSINETSFSHRWFIVSSSDKILSINKAQLPYLDNLIKRGTVRPNNFGHSNTAPENYLLRPTIKSTEHHGYFRTLKDVRDYIKMEQLIG